MADLSDHEGVKTAKLAVLTDQSSTTAVARKHIGDPASPDGVMAVLKKAASDHVQSGFILGCGLLVLKAGCPHGEFVHLATSLGFAERTASRYMATARFVIESGHADVLSALPGYKVEAIRKALSAAGGVAVEELIDDEGNILGYSPEAMQNVSVDELRADLANTLDDMAGIERRCKDLEAERNGLKLKLETANERARQAENRQRAGRLDLPAFAAEARQEIAVGADQAGLALAHIRAMFLQHLEPHQQALEDDDLRAAHNAAGLAWFSLNAIKAEADALQRQIADAFPEVSAGLMPQFSLSEDETRLAAVAGKELRARMGDRQTNRRVERGLAEARRTSRAGRPPKFVAER